MAKVLATVALHYGTEYLDAAIRAIDPFVDKIVILYSEDPSYGFQTSMRCPETAGELSVIAHNASNKVKWVNITSSAENHHRGMIYRFAEGYDGILTFDADEVYESADVQAFIDYCNNSDKRYFGVDGYVNFWKSFNWACYDGFRPIRYINLKNREGEDLNAKCRIYHFSCAQKMSIMEYKLQVHGHKNEFPRSMELRGKNGRTWLKSIYEAWTPGNNFEDLHLVSLNLWNAVPFDKTTLPQILKEHPNYNKESIV